MVFLALETDSEGRSGVLKAGIFFSPHNTQITEYPASKYINFPNSERSSSTELETLLKHYINTHPQGDEKPKLSSMC